METQNITRESLAAIIDHAVLSPAATLCDLRDGCELAARYHVASVCVRSCDVAPATEFLAGAPVAVGAVIGFPHGGSDSSVKAAEAVRAVDEGAGELDMVINISHLREQRIDEVRSDIAAVVRPAAGRPVKVILECCYLDQAQMAAGCRAAAEAGAAFVKTSTGFGPSGATVEDVRFLRRQVGNRLGVKAAGGIATLVDALAMIRVGASRIGTSKTNSILKELKAN
ncbi:MAG: deoxyribose-phosphate aldolase [Phycisphaerae bacterium]|jgi:deoxyribose-phosphate aldolase|nr:deoxyribose-phosphate aldolase [Phycisphaerae bacterium]